MQTIVQKKLMKRYMSDLMKPMMKKYQKDARDLVFEEDNLDDDENFYVFQPFLAYEVINLSKYFISNKSHLPNCRYRLGAQSV